MGRGPTSRVVVFCHVVVKTSKKTVPAKIYCFRVVRFLYANWLESA